VGVGFVAGFWLRVPQPTSETSGSGVLASVGTFWLVSQPALEPSSSGALVSVVMFLYLINFKVIICAIPTLAEVKL